jgi:hypothetical protein
VTWNLHCSLLTEQKLAVSDYVSPEHDNDSDNELINPEGILDSTSGRPRERKAVRTDVFAATAAGW